MTGRAADESCISGERGAQIASGSALARTETATSQAALARWPAVTGVHGPDTLRKANEDFTEAVRLSKRIIALAKDLLQAREDGVAAFEGAVRQQVRDAAFGQAGIDELAIGPEIAIILRIMLAEARARVGAGGVKPDFAILSIFRPGDGPSSPHRKKLALDISRYAGHVLNISNGSAVASGATQFYRDLAAHASEITFNYGFGLPRNLRTGDSEIASELSGNYGKIHMDIFARSLGRSLSNGQSSAKLNEEIRQKYKFVDVFFDHSATPGRSPHGTVDADIKGMVWPGLDAAWQQIRSSGGSHLRAIFPDEVDHLHVQVIQ